MKLNPDVYKRLSSYVNDLAIIVGGAMLYIPEMGFEPSVTAKIMFGCTILVKLAQVIRFKDEKK